MDSATVNADTNNWLNYVDTAAFGKKIAGEYFTVATTAAATGGNAATLTVNAATDCMT